MGGAYNRKFTVSIKATKSSKYYLCLLLEAGEEEYYCSCKP